MSKQPHPHLLQAQYALALTFAPPDQPIFFFPVRLAFMYAFFFLLAILRMTLSDHGWLNFVEVIFDGTCLLMTWRHVCLKLVHTLSTGVKVLFSERNPSPKSQMSSFMPSKLAAFHRYISLRVGFLLDQCHVHSAQGLVHISVQGKVYLCRICPICPRCYHS